MSQYETRVRGDGVRRPAPPPPLLCRRRTGHHNARLTTYEVAELRRWARTDGSGLSVFEQASLVHTECPGYADIPLHTLVSVLRGDGVRPPAPHRPLLHRRRTGHHNAATRLSKYEVADIRHWARTDGFGLGVYEQARRLQAEFPGFADIPLKTLVSVLNGDTWPDPTYDRTTPLPEAVPTAEPVAWWSLLMGAPVWFVLAMLWRTILCGNDSSRGGRAATR